MGQQPERSGAHEADKGERIVIPREIFSAFPQIEEGLIPYLALSGKQLPSQVDDLVVKANMMYCSSRRTWSQWRK